MKQEFINNIIKTIIIALIGFSLLLCCANKPKINNNVCSDIEYDIAYYCDMAQKNQVKNLHVCELASQYGSDFCYNNRVIEYNYKSLCKQRSILIHKSIATACFVKNIHYKNCVSLIESATNSYFWKCKSLR